MRGSSTNPWYTPPSPRGYQEVLNAVMTYGEEQRNARTGRTIKVVPHLSWTHSMEPIRSATSRAELPLCGLRKVSLKTSAAELAWMLQGTRSLTWLKKHTPMWNQFAVTDAIEDPDVLGVVTYDDIIEAAYGWRWRTAFGRDQIKMALLALLRDSTDRQIHVGTWNPSIDGLGDPGRSRKNVPCITGFTLSAINGTLHTSVDLRSSDVVVGLPYDMLTFALLTDAMATSVGMTPGFVTLNLAHAHVYDVHWDVARDMLTPFVHPVGLPGHVNPIAPAWTVQAIEDDPDGYVQMVQSLPHMQTDRHPRVEVVP